MDLIDVYIAYPKISHPLNLYPVLVIIMAVILFLLLITSLTFTISNKAVLRWIQLELGFNSNFVPIESLA